MTCLDDAMVLGLVEGRLPPPVLATVDEHLDGCASCRDVVTHIARSLSPARTLERGATVGRYVIGELVGEGAMGRVYSAWEPELDRRVALKLLSTSDAREARAMAKLDHPNVVGVHEVGTADGHTYVAMELVEGDTLRAWVAKRPWREIIVVLADIARGLAAVHAAGVIHRDVKPDNIIVGNDGRARVGDFGLARAGTAPPIDGDFAIGTPTTIAGTPAYMAPEVAAGESATPASDQFSFGVTAYEALAGKRPFIATTFAGLREAYASSPVAPLRDVPPWLDAAVRRCLAIDPSARFAGVVDFADVVAKSLHRRSPRLLIAGITSAAIVASGATYLALRAPAAAPSCALGATEIASAWDRTQLGSLAAPTLAALDAWTAAWARERDATCAAGRTEPAPAIVARTRCLDRRRDELAALTIALRTWSSPAAPRLPGADALDAIVALPDPADCRLAATDPADPVPLDPTLAAIVTRVQHELATLRATLALGDARPMLGAARALVETARSSGHTPTLAEAGLLHADALRATSQLETAAAVALAAAADAERGHADHLAARVWLTRVAIAGDRRDLTSAAELAALASAAIDRAGGSPRLVAAVLKQQGLIAYNRSDLDAARRLLMRAYKLLAGIGNVPLTDGTVIAHEDPLTRVERISIQSALGSVERAANHLDAAETWHQGALDADRALRGPMHPDVARDLHNLAGVARLRGDLALAHDRYTEALRIEIATRGERSVEAGLTHNSLGLVELARGSHAQAIAQFTLARDILTTGGHGDRAFAEHNLGLAAAALGDHANALAHYDAAATLYAQTIGPDADAAKRLVEDRATSESAVAKTRTRPIQQIRVEPAPTRPTSPVVGMPAPTEPSPVPPPPPAKKRDVGVYGSTQSW